MGWGLQGSSQERKNRTTCFGHLHKFLSLIPPPPANSTAAIWSPSPPMRPQQPYPSVSLHSTSSYTLASISLHNVHTHTVASSPPFTQAANTPHPSSLPYLVALIAPDPIQFINLVSVRVSILSNTSDPGLDRPLVQISRAATWHG